MSGISYLFLFFPIVLVILLVLEACRSEEPVKIVKRALGRAPPEPAPWRPARSA